MSYTLAAIGVDCYDSDLVFSDRCADVAFSECFVECSTRADCTHFAHSKPAGYGQCTLCKSRPNGTHEGSSGTSFYRVYIDPGKSVY